MFDVRLESMLHRDAESAVCEGDVAFVAAGAGGRSGGCWMRTGGCCGHDWWRGLGMAHFGWGVGNGMRRVLHEKVMSVVALLVPCVIMSTLQVE